MNKPIIFNSMFGNLFRKKSEKESPKQVSESKSILDSYLSAKKEIDYLEDKYDDFVVRSLQVEFEKYKQFVDATFPRVTDGRNHWMLSEIKYDQFTLEKKDGTNDIKINAHYEFYQSEWKLKWASVIVGWNSTDLDKEKISDVLFQYFIYWRLKEIEKERETKKQSFQKMVDIIGKDVKRDSLIDQILS